MHAIFRAMGRVGGFALFLQMIAFFAHKGLSEPKGRISLLKGSIMVEWCLGF